MTLLSHKLLLHRLGIKDEKSSKSPPISCTRTAPALLASSSFTHQSSEDVDRILKASDSGRRLLSDKKQPFEQFQPKKLVISTARVIATQAATTVSYFVTDQLDQELKTEKLVNEGKLTNDEAEQKNEEWEKREWQSRWSTFGTRCIHGVLKYQAITLTMRFYECLLSSRVDEVVLDRLTKDPFKAAKRTAAVTGDTKEIIRPMFETCLWSNVIAFLSDYTVHQVILAVTYYMYGRQKRRQRRQEHDDTEESDAEEGAIVMTFSFKSAQLLVARALGLLSAAAGGALGSYVYPGWGTTIGTQAGDGLMATALEERTS